MPGLFSRFRARDTSRFKKKHDAQDFASSLPEKPQWVDAYARKTVEPEEVQELLHYCVEELKAQALDLPFLLLPFRPTSDPSAVRTFIRHVFSNSYPPGSDNLVQELRMTEPMVIADVTKWCWSRLQGGIVGWDTYELFKVGEYDSNKARNAFKTFIPISVQNPAKQSIIFDFFDLIAAIAAHGKSNGFGGWQLPRMAAWWAFEQKDTGGGFDGGYKAWLKAADATTHLFFAYLRSLSPEQPTGISLLPRSLEKLLKETPYPPMKSQRISSRTNKLVMMVDSVSPTPFSLLRRAGHFQYRDSDRGLQEFSEYEDPVEALTEECIRVLTAISQANESQVSSIKHSASWREASWSRFEDVGFGSALEDEVDDVDRGQNGKAAQGSRSTPSPNHPIARPTTPSWADFLSSGFVADSQVRSSLLLPPEKYLPPIEVQLRQQSSQSHQPRLESERKLEPGELANITQFDLDDAFWWVWMSSLAPEETSDRKAAFGRCAVIETKIGSARWIVVEEMIAGTAPEPEEGAYIAEKKRFFTWTKRSKAATHRKSTIKPTHDHANKYAGTAFDGNKAGGSDDAHAKIQAKAAQLRAMNNCDQQPPAPATQRRGRSDADMMEERTYSTVTLQPTIVGEASSAMTWVKKYDKSAIKDAYLANSNAGRGIAVSPDMAESLNGFSPAANGSRQVNNSPLPAPPGDESSGQRVSIGSHQPSSTQTPSAELEQTDSPASNPTKAGETVVAIMERDMSESSASPQSFPHQFETRTDTQNVMAGGPVHMGPQPPKQPKGLFHGTRQKSGTLRKLFARKNRSSRLPPNASADLAGILQQEQLAVEQAMQQIPTPAATPSPELECQSPSLVQELAVPAGHAAVEEEAVVESSETNSDAFLSRDVSRTFSSHDAGDFSQDDSHPATNVLRQQTTAESKGSVMDIDDAVPPPIARHSLRQEDSDTSQEDSRDELTQSAGPGVQDRWAQIRKNAAERAVTRRRGDHDGEFSGRPFAEDHTGEEETIESRVARIKARVAELTGNMDGAGAQHAIASSR